MSRRILKHGFIVLMIGLGFGAVTGAMQDPSLRKLWLAGHITGILFGLMMVAIGVAWPQLRLGPTASKVLWWCTVPASYFGVTMLGAFANLVRFSPPILTPEMPQVEGWPFGVVVVSTAITAVSNIIAFGLVIYGLRGEATAQGQAAGGLS